MILCFNENQITINDNSTFNDLRCQSNDNSISCFMDKNKNTFSLYDKIIENGDYIAIYRKNLLANVANVFGDILNVPIVSFVLMNDLCDSNILDRYCEIKVQTDLTYSTADFEKYKKLIKEKIQNVNIDVPEVLKSYINVEIMNVLPFDFDIIKVAQEVLNDVLVQKFTIVIFDTENDRVAYNAAWDDLKKTDHRYIGKALDLFMLIPEAPGSVFWLPKGWKIFKKLEAFVRKYAYLDYQEVKTPFVMSNSFWKKSGHLVSFKQNMMFVNMGNSTDEDSALKPMSCPAHIEIFQKQIRSYKELPLRLAEFGCCHRYEPSGSLHGLMRVRSLTQDDGHIFCLMEQVKQETVRFLNECINIYSRLGFGNPEIILATKPDNALGNDDDWKLAEQSLSESLKEIGLDFTVAEGEGAFYGPKIELHIKDSLNRNWQLGTIQLDFVLPERFEISVVSENGTKGKVCMLHRAILGSLERFIGLFLEHTGGRLPAFLAPVQIVICPISSDFNEYSESLKKNLLNYGLDVIVDNSNETLSYKIRVHKTLKVPGLVIVGKKEVENEFLTLEFSGQKMEFKLKDIEKMVRLFNEN